METGFTRGGVKEKDKASFQKYYNTITFIIQNLLILYGLGTYFIDESISSTSIKPDPAILTQNISGSDRLADRMKCTVSASCKLLLVSRTGNQVCPFAVVAGQDGF